MSFLVPVAEIPDTGRPVQLVSVPEEGVPSAGVVRVGLVSVLLVSVCAPVVVTTGTPNAVTPSVRTLPLEPVGSADCQGALVW